MSDFEGNIRKRISVARIEYCSPLSEPSVLILKHILDTEKPEYKKFQFYDEKYQIGETLSLHFSLGDNEIERLEDTLPALKSKLGHVFNFKDIQKAVSEIELPIDLSKAKKFVPSNEVNYTINFFNPLYKSINKQRGFSKVWFSLIST